MAKAYNYGSVEKKLSADSLSQEQEHNGFSESAKLCLNLSSERWLEPNHNLVNNFIPSGP